MSELKTIEKRILETKQLINDIPKSFSNGTVVALEVLNKKIEYERKPLQEQLEILETKRQFILDNREGWSQKILWNIIYPIIVALLTTLLTAYLSIKFGLIK